MVIAVSGKGGAGKSTLAALIVRHLLRKNEKPILAVDADPNSNFGDKLGLVADITIGSLREDVLKSKYAGPVGIPKQNLIEYGVQDAVAEGKGFDLVVMGRGEGPGCYCSVNNMLRTFLQGLSSRYKHVVIDNEAGMEHLSRRTNDKVDLMLIVSDPTPTCMRSAKRIAELACELEVVRGQMWLLLNRVTNYGEVERSAREYVGLELFGCIPEDFLIQKYELECKSILDLPNDSKAVTALARAFERIEM
ncbi:MAG: AAA family ATPase [Armatimonadetes bacterium]|nr:AAA family ATPase [Armatimonadota bacterium]